MLAWSLALLGGPRDGLEDLLGAVARQAARMVRACACVCISKVLLRGMLHATCMHA